MVPHPGGVCGNVVPQEETLLPPVPGSWWLFVLCSLGSFGSVVNVGFWFESKRNEQAGARGAPGAAGTASGRLWMVNTRHTLNKSHSKANRYFGVPSIHI